MNFFGSLNTDLNVVDLVTYTLAVPAVKGNPKKNSEVLSENSENEEPKNEEDFTINYFGLTSDDKLMHNGIVVLTDCTSFTVADNSFLLFTSLNQGMYDLLHSYTLADVTKGNFTLMNTQLPKSTDGKSHNIRNVERGSKIVVAADNRVIFQLPRGNFEGINPKLLVLHQVKENLKLREYY